MSVSRAARNVQARNRKDAAVKAAPVPAVAKPKSKAQMAREQKAAFPGLVTMTSQSRKAAAAKGVATKAAKAEAKAALAKIAPKAPKVDIACRCECGGITKGGKFLPGHDARHASNLVAEYTKVLVSGGPTPTSTKVRLSLQAEADAVSPAFGAKVAKGMDRAAATA